MTANHTQNNNVNYSASPRASDFDVPPADAETWNLVASSKPVNVKPLLEGALSSSADSALDATAAAARELLRGKGKA